MENMLQIIKKNNNNKYFEKLFLSAIEVIFDLMNIIYLSKSTFYVIY